MPNKRAKIAVVIPTYNRPEFLIRAVKSVILQRQDDLVIFISDNCSDLDVQSAIEELNYPGIIYYRQPRNIGMQGNWQFCLEQGAQLGEYVALLEDDNLYLPGHLGEAIKLLEAYRQSFYFCNSYLGKNLYIDKFKEIQIRESHALDLVELIVDINLPATGVVFRAEALSCIAFSAASDLWCMDRFYWRSIIIEKGFIFNPAVKVEYTLHEGNITRDFLKNRKSIARASAQNRFVDYFSFWIYLCKYPQSVNEVSWLLLNREISEIRHLLPCFYGSNRDSKIVDFGNGILNCLMKKNQFLFYKYLPSFLAKILIKKINPCNEWIGSWSAPSLRSMQ